MLKAKFTIPTVNWTSALVNAIESAEGGEVIEVHTIAMQELAERALARMCPDKSLIVEVHALVYPSWVES